jgi:hypothetical protein
VNWLTLQIATLQSLGSLHEGAQSHVGSTLRRLPFETVQQVLNTLPVTIDLGQSKDAIEERKGHLYIEDAAAAQSRERAATSRPGSANTLQPSPLQFTVAISDELGATIYLPDEDADELDVQLFAGYHGGEISRVRISGSFSPGSAILGPVTLEPPGPCADGPCVEWATECGGGGCLCHKFVGVEVRQLDRLRRLFGGGRRLPRLAVLKCYVDIPSGG